MEAVVKLCERVTRWRDGVAAGGCDYDGYAGVDAEHDGGNGEGGRCGGGVCDAACDGNDTAQTAQPQPITDLHRHAAGCSPSPPPTPHGLAIVSRPNAMLCRASTRPLPNSMSSTTRSLAQARAPVHLPSPTTTTTTYTHPPTCAPIHTYKHTPHPLLIPPPPPPLTHTDLGHHEHHHRQHNYFARSTQPELQPCPLSTVHRERASVSLARALGQIGWP